MARRDPTHPTTCRMACCADHGGKQVYKPPRKRKSAGLERVVCVDTLHDPIEGYTKFAQSNCVVCNGHKVYWRKRARKGEKRG